MQAHQQSGTPHNNPTYPTQTQYQHLKSEYNSNGITFKGNQIIHKIAEIKGYPYGIVVDIVKMFHMNQFEVVFYCHILHDEECSYQADPGIFQTGMNLPDLVRVYNRLTNNGERQIKIMRKDVKVQLEQQQQQYEQPQQNTEYWTIKQLRKLYVYLLVIGYSVKYYLNQSTKIYQQQLKRRYPEFFTTIFNTWVDKYGNKVLRTNPRKINQFYIDMFQSEENMQIDNTEIDCQYRNYNQIVEELIKATTDVEAQEGGHEEEKDFVDN